MTDPNDPTQQPPAYTPPPPPQMPPPPPGGGYMPAPPPVAGYGAPVAVPPGMTYDAESGLTLPAGVVLAPVGRRVGAFFLSIPLAIVTLGIGYIIWGAMLWGQGTSPALKVLGMKVWKPSENKVATWGGMALRDIVGYIVQGILSFITLLVSFIMFLTGKEHKTLADVVGGTVVVYDPNKVLG